MRHRPLARAGVLLGVGALAALLAALPAAGHVTAQPGTATRGGYGKIAFRVPDESATAGTVKLEVTLPTDPPVVSVRTTPMPGWTAQIVKAPLAMPVESDGEKITESVRTVAWTAQPVTRIGPTEFQDFEISLRLPATGDQLVMPAVQTYDDGTVVTWDAPPVAAGTPEPEHPAPVVTLVAVQGGAVQGGSDVQGSDAQGSDAQGGAAPGALASPASPDQSDNTARWLGGAGLVAGVLGLGLGAGAVLRTRRGAV